MKLGKNDVHGTTIASSDMDLDDRRNLAGIAILLIGWATNTSALLSLGLVVLVASLAVRIITQLGARRRRS